MAKKRDIYLMSNGQPVTEGSVSELCGILDKPFLVPWAAKMTVEKVAELWTPDVPHSKQYIELALEESKRAHRVKKDTAGDIGTEVHLIVGMYVEGQLAARDITHPEKKKALENFIKTTQGWEWLGSEVVVINEWWECSRCGTRVPTLYAQEVETDLVCCESPLGMYGYGGTADALARINGKIHLIDFKTSNFISPTYSMQCALYAAATPSDAEPGFVGAWKEIQEARILHFNKEFLTWECLERNISEQLPYIPHFIGCRRWKKRFENKNYSEFGKGTVAVRETGSTISFGSSR